MVDVPQHALQLARSHDQGVGFLIVISFIEFGVPFSLLLVVPIRDVLIESCPRNFTPRCVIAIRN
ncbi:hypothetical protein ASE08_14955 [Rhizobacter sp. Root16D2]|nr:hypothetical protein ASC88_01700 [Rhizobacter sp. Root29]KQW12053.1 hypothetical protein ASC98_19870 [Rhizobacter sp. Root1238]KRB02868.1 hypothetical protein ASE08_14955 [Rhizobacter sp. Root16D2]